MGITRMDEFLQRTVGMTRQTEIDKLKAQNRIHEDPDAPDYYKKQTQIFVFKTLKPIEKGTDVEDKFFNVVKVYFPNPEYKLLFEKYFNILRYMNENVHNIEPLMILLSLIETGKIKWEKHRNTGSLTFLEDLTGKKFTCKEDAVYEENNG